MEKIYLILKRGSASRPSGERNDDDYDVLANYVVVGRILKLNAAPAMSWMWALEPLSPFNITGIARQLTGMQRRARPRWQHSRRAGGANECRRNLLGGSRQNDSYGGIRQM